MTAPVNRPCIPTGLPIGLRSGVHTGPATILSTVDGEGIKEYAVEITACEPCRLRPHRKVWCYA